MSIFERVCSQDGCIQCWSEELLGLPLDALGAEMERQVRQDPKIIMVGQPSPEDMVQMRRSGIREARLVARLALLEPHECGKVVVT